MYTWADVLFDGISVMIPWNGWKSNENKAHIVAVATATTTSSATTTTTPCVRNIQNTAQAPCIHNAKSIEVTTKMRAVSSTCTAKKKKSTWKQELCAWYAVGKGKMKEIPVNVRCRGNLLLFSYGNSYFRWVELKTDDRTQTGAANVSETRTNIEICIRTATCPTRAHEQHTLPYQIYLHPSD